MPKDTLRDVFQGFAEFLQEKGTSYQIDKCRGRVYSIRTILRLPLSGMRICRMVRVDGHAVLIVRVGHYKPKRLKRIGLLVEEMTGCRIEVLGGRVKWVLAVDPATLERLGYQTLMDIVDYEVSSTDAAIRRIAPHPYEPPPFLMSYSEETARVQ